MSINRREFLLLRPGRPGVELSCERLYMKYLDARTTGDADQLFTRLAGELSRVTTVGMIDSEWLAPEEFRHELDAVLGAFRARGGRIHHILR